MRLRWIALLVLIIAAAGLRLTDLLSESLWLDEIATVSFIAGNGLIDVVRETFRADYHPFVYYALLDAWSALLGTSEAACRLLSVLLGVATVVAAYRLGMTVAGGTGPALAVAAVTTVAPALVWYSQECRMYILLVLAWVLCIEFLMRAVESGLRTGPSAGLVVAFLLFAYAHGSAGVVTLPFVLGAVLCPPPAGGGRVSESRAPGRTHANARTGHGRRRLVLAGVLLTAYAPWMIRLLVLEAGDKSLGRLGPSDVRELVVWLTFFNHRPPAAGVAALWLVVALSVAWFLGMEIRGKSRPAVRLVAASLVVPVATASVISLFVPFYQARNLIFLAVPAIALASNTVLEVIRAVMPRRTRWGRILPVGLAAVLLAGVLGYLASITVRNLAEAPQKENWRDATRHIMATAHPGDIVAFYAGFTASCFEFYAARDTVVARVRKDMVKRSSELSLMSIEREPALFRDSAARLLDEIGRRKSHVTWVVYSHVTTPARLEELLLASGLARQSATDFRNILVVSYARERGNAHSDRMPDDP